MGAVGCRADMLDRCGTIQVPANSKLARAATAAAFDGPGDMLDPAASQHLPVMTSQKGLAKFKTPFTGHLDRNLEDITPLDLLFESARAGAYKDVVGAIARGADINAKTLRGTTALMLAAGSSTKTSLDTVKFLIEAMSALEEKDALGWTALLHACRNSQQTIVEYLLECNSSLKVRSFDARTAAMLATMDNADSLVQDLVNRRVDIAKKDDQGWSLMFYACEHRRFELVKWLIKRNASVKDKAKDASSCLMLVAANGSVKIASMLCRRNANMNSKNAFGSTALLIALKSRQNEVADFLLEEGADVTIKNGNEQDAADVAEEMGMLAMKQKIETKVRKNLDEEQQAM
eukprot:TRINITY_DN20596_c0_g1_i1.p1 TRINITY_DN20596_c0_g1~~TRINITY_DN20596_c0_g1_i1.p1  ORF type:complete len:347 (+),score=69.35 TRINITY_DN20596_c0_g1_i1:222-1262(+)